MHPRPQPAHIRRPIRATYNFYIQRERLSQLIARLVQHSDLRPAAWKTEERPRVRRDQRG
jgi:hypothetical protein